MGSGVPTCVPRAREFLRAIEHMHGARLNAYLRDATVSAASPAARRSPSSGVAPVSSKHEVSNAPKTCGGSVSRPSMENPSSVSSRVKTSAAPGPCQWVRVGSNSALVSARRVKDIGPERRAGQRMERAHQARIMGQVSAGRDASASPASPAFDRVQET